MIDAGVVSRLLELRPADHAIVSVYLTVPLDPAQQKGMLARVEDLFRGTGRGDSEAWARARQAELPAIRSRVSTQAHTWLGHTVAIFACAEIGLLETIPLREQVTDRAVIGSRPYVRPLLAELCRSPGYVVAVVDHRHAWMYRVSGEVIEPGQHLESATVGSRRFGGWNGFQSYRNDQRARRLAQQHYAAAAAALASTAAPGTAGPAAAAAGRAGSGKLETGAAGTKAAGTKASGAPIVIGGHEAETGEFLAVLPAALRDRVAGTFVIDPHTMTPARVRQLADQVMAGWEDEREQRLATSLAGQAPGAMTAVGLDACVAAANQHAIQLLVVPDDEVRPGFTCERCGALAVTGGACGACGADTRAVGDVIEELAVKVTRDGGGFQPVRSGRVLTDVAARRRFPAPA